MTDNDTSKLYDSLKVSRFETVINCLHEGTPEDVAMHTALDMIHYAIKHEIDFRSIFESAQGIYIDEITRDRQVQVETEGE